MFTKKTRSDEAILVSSCPIFSYSSASTQECVPPPALLEESFDNLKNFDSEVKSEAIAACPSCGCTKFNLVRMPDECIHDAAKRCGECDRFLGWQAKPETQEKRQQWQSTINLLLQAQELTDWEHEFLLSIRDRKSLSPKQQAVVTQIETKVGGAV